MIYGGFAPDLEQLAMSGAAGIAMLFMSAVDNQEGNLHKDSP